MTLTDLLLPSYIQTLKALSAWLSKAAGERGADGDALMAARLADDMFPLATQVRFACIQAYEGVHRLRHEPLPQVVDVLRREATGEDEEPGTIADAVAHIDATLAFLESQPSDAMDAGAGQPLALELPVGIAFDLQGEQYARDWALPQFYFHIMAAYTILRNQGVALGKVDFVPHMFTFLRPGTGPKS
ncbi:MAG: DUF1993 domain-containing protein [Oceanicaulis sp.]